MQSTSTMELGNFGATRWTLVVAAGGNTTPEAEAALAELCEIYWYPLYAYVRRFGHEREDAQHITQDFLARLVEKNSPATVDRAQGKFRSFLLAALRNFLANEGNRRPIQKQSRDCDFLPLDFRTTESRHPLEPAQELTPERLFDRQWVLALLDRVILRLEQEYAADGRQALFEKLKPFLVAQSAPRVTAQLAEEMGVGEGAVKLAIHRLRKRYRQLLRAEIGQTVTCAEEVDEEIRALFSIFR